MEKKITVTLAGQIFTIINQEDLDYVEEIARQTDSKIKQVKKENDHFSVTAAAVLSCMDFCDELNRAQKEIIQRNKDLFEEKEKNNLLTEQLRNLMNEVQALKLAAARASQAGESSDNQGKDQNSGTGDKEGEGETGGESHLWEKPEEKETERESRNLKNENAESQKVQGDEKRPGKKEYVPRNNRKRNKNKKESGTDK